MARTGIPPAQILSFIVLGTFLTFVLFLAIAQEADIHGDDPNLSNSGSESSSKKEQDLDRYVSRRTLSDEELDFDGPGRRILFVGDIHGMKESLDKLLSKVHYNPLTDHLIHVGDIAAKGLLDGTLDVVSFMTQHNVTGVRGNHDQMVIGWRAWVENVLSRPSGRAWLEKLESKSVKHRQTYLKELKKAVRKGKEAVWKGIPDDWEFMGDHYTISRKMTDEEAAYLRSLPLVMHIPRFHAFVVHAGLLPLDPRRSATSGRQPLAHIPKDGGSKRKGGKKGNVERLRTKQEEAVLSDVPQNNDPWNVINIRSILKDNSVSRDGKEGSAWAPLWNSIVSRCGGFDLDVDFSRDIDEGAASSEHDKFDDDNDTSFGLINNALRISKEKPLPCYPSTVIYGHAASRGLDIRRWTKGLDTGCVYGRRLTALELTHPSSVDESDEDEGEDEDESEDDDSDSNVDDDDSDDEETLRASSRNMGKKMRFGDHSGSDKINARIVSVSCPDL